MLKRKLKKYRLMYRTDLVITQKHSNNIVISTLDFNKRKNDVFIADIDAFYHKLDVMEKSYELWEKDSEQYCDLSDKNRRNEMVYPSHMITKTYLSSNDTLYDIANDANIKTIFRNFNKVLNDIRNCYEYKIAAENLKTDGIRYVDEIIHSYEEVHNKNTY